MTNLSVAEQDVLTTIQEKIKLKQMPIKLEDLASSCYVSPSSIVKLAKKLGYSGFREMIYQMEFGKSSLDIPFYFDLIDGNINDLVDLVASKLIEYSDSKCIIVETNREELVSKYLSRKLAMFDIFAPVSYDYTMINNYFLNSGICIFPDAKVLENDAVKKILNLAKKKNYYIICFCEEKNDFINKYVDLAILFKNTHYKDANLFNAKVLIFIELVLARMASKLRGNND